MGLDCELMQPSTSEKNFCSPSSESARPDTGGSLPYVVVQFRKMQMACSAILSFESSISLMETLGQQASCR